MGPKAVTVVLTMVKENECSDSLAENCLAQDLDCLHAGRNRGGQGAAGRRISVQLDVEDDFRRQAVGCSQKSVSAVWMGPCIAPAINALTDSERLKLERNVRMGVVRIVSNSQHPDFDCPAVKKRTRGRRQTPNTNTSQPWARIQFRHLIGRFKKTHRPQNLLADACMSATITGTHTS